MKTNNVRKVVSISLLLFFIFACTNGEPYPIDKNDVNKQSMEFAKLYFETALLQSLALSKTYDTPRWEETHQIENQDFTSFYIPVNNVQTGKTSYLLIARTGYSIYLYIINLTDEFTDFSSYLQKQLKLMQVIDGRNLNTIGYLYNYPSNYVANTRAVHCMENIDIYLDMDDELIRGGKSTKFISCDKNSGFRLPEVIIIGHRPIPKDPDAWKDPFKYPWENEDNEIDLPKRPGIKELFEQPHGSGNTDNKMNGDHNQYPNATTLFRNAGMTQKNWQKLERMLDKMIKDCMGASLFNGLKEKLLGKTLIIKFNPAQEGGSFGYDGSSSAISISENMESNQLMHELFHAYQAYNETHSSFAGATLNLEIEAHYAQYIYLKKLPEYSGSKWEQGYMQSERLRAIANLQEYIDDKGNLIARESLDLFDTYTEFSLVPSFRKSAGYSHYLYDKNRTSLSNFSNLRILTKNC